MNTKQRRSVEQGTEIVAINAMVDMASVKENVAVVYICIYAKFLSLTYSAYFRCIVLLISSSCSAT